MSGWLIKASSPGMTRRIIQVYAARIAEEAAALAAVEQRTGGNVETLSALPDDAMDYMGLIDEGQIGRVQCIF